MPGNRSGYRLPPEVRLILWAAGDDVPGDDAREWLSGSDIELLVALAAREGALPYLWRGLQEVAGLELAEPLVARMRPLTAIFGHRQAQLECAFSEALSTLDRAGIEVMALKGAALASTVYGGFEDRPMADLDLLVPVSESQRAHAELRGAGWSWDRSAFPADLYRELHHLPPLVHPERGNIALEVHTDVLAPHHPFRLPASRLWETASQATTGRGSVLVPDRPHLLLHLCLHFAWAKWLGRDGWLALRDARALTPGFDEDTWETFLGLAVEARSATCCYWTLRLARDLASTSVPEAAFERLEPAVPKPLLDALARHHVRVLFHPDGCPSLALRRWMWIASVRPRQSGHGSARPWGHSIRLPGGPGNTDAAEPSSGSSTIRATWDRLAVAAEWLRDVAGAAPPAS